VTAGLRASARPLLSALGAALLAVSASPGSGAAAVPACASFPSQAAAQEHLAALGTGPGRVGRLDSDGDGIACEGLAGPYKGFVTIGYSPSRRFFFGAVSMPPDVAGGFACLEGNRHFADAPRLLAIYRVQPGSDLEVVSEVPTGAQAGSGRLLWKAEKGPIAPGLYYAEVEARIPLTPYGGNDCPGFRSRVAMLPPPASQRR
jgi:hypothetical protein